VVYLDDGATRAAGGAVLCRGLASGGGVCAGQGETSLVPPDGKSGCSKADVRQRSRAAVLELWPIQRPFASDSATNLQFYNRIPRHEVAEEQIPRRHRGRKAMLYRWTLHAAAAVIE
jgi:hypothetical protein